MINDISGLTNDNPFLPYLIWWLLKPQEQCLLDLAEQCPAMTRQIAIACIFCNYEFTYKRLRNLRPHIHLWAAAKQSPHPFYREDLQKRAAEEGYNLERE